MTPERSAELRLLDLRASRGPWACDLLGNRVVRAWNGKPIELAADDGAFVVAARTGLPEALDAIDRVRALTREQVARSLCSVFEHPNKCTGCDPDQGCQGWDQFLGQADAVLAHISTALEGPKA